MKPISIPCLVKPKVSPREQYRNLNSSKANVTLANERLVAAVNSATWVGSVAGIARIRCDCLTSPSVRLAR